MRSLEDLVGDEPVVVSGRALVSRVRDRMRADQRRQLQRLAWGRHFERWDVMLTPVMPLTAIHHDHERSIAERVFEVDGATQPYTSLMAWCGLIGAMLIPVVALPIGAASDGMPVGVQVIGPAYHDLDLLAIAGQLDAVAGDHRIPPGFEQ
jgi:amidase